MQFRGILQPQPQLPETEIITLKTRLKVDPVVSEATKNYHPTSSRCMPIFKIMMKSNITIIITLDIMEKV